MTPNLFGSSGLLGSAETLEDERVSTSPVDTTDKTPTPYSRQPATAAGVPTGPVVNLLNADGEVVRRMRDKTRTAGFEPDGWRPPLPFYHRSSVIVTASSPRQLLQRVSSPNGAHVWVEGRFSKISNVPLIPDVSKTESEALVKARNKILDQEVNLSVALAESRRTLAMIVANLRRIRRSVVSFKRRRPQQWKQVKKVQLGGLPRHRWCEIPEAWLEIQYGWRPLMSDIFGAIAEFKRSSDPLLIQARARGSTTFGHEADVTSAALTVSLRTAGTQPLDYRQDSYALLVYELDASDFRRQAQLGLINPAEVVWELLPYSFVVDWFLPVGPFVSSLTAGRGLKWKGGRLATILRGHDSGIGKPMVTIRGQSIAPQRHHVRVESFDRKAYQTEPFPGLYVKNPLTPEHFLNAMALLAVAFKR